MSKITIYSTASCPYCVQAKQLLDRKGLTYQEIRVDTDPNKMEEMLAKSANKRTVPQIFINEHHVGGYTDLHALDQNGGLVELLK